MSRNNQTLRDYVIMSGELKENTPAHWFHLLLSFLTCGIWLPIWCLYSAVCCYCRNKIRVAYEYSPSELNIAAIICVFIVLSLLSVVIGLWLSLGGTNV